MDLAQKLSIVSIVAEIISAIAAITIPILLIYWAPKIAKSNQRNAKENIDGDLKVYLSQISETIENALIEFPKKGYGKKLASKEEQRLKALSAQMQTRIDNGLIAFQKTMSETGKGSLLMTVKAIEAQSVSEKMTKDREQDFSDWIDNPKIKLTEASAHKHFENIKIVSPKLKPYCSKPHSFIKNPKIIRIAYDWERNRMFKGIVSCFLINRMLLGGLSWIEK